MPLKSGLAGQVGFATETVYGTGVTVTRFVPLIDESISQDIDRLESSGVIAGARVLRSQQWSAGNRKISGDIGLEVYDRSVGLLFRHMFGVVATTGTGPYTHTFTPGDLDDDSFTMQIGRPDIAGTVQPFTYAGCKVSQWELACAAGEIATLGLTVAAQSETTLTALATAAYATGIAPLTFVGGSLTIAAGAYPIKKITLSGDNKLDYDRYFVGSDLMGQPLEADLREYTGTIESEFQSLTAYNRFVNGTEAALVVHLAKGASTVDITCNVRFDGETPKLAGRGILQQPLPFKCVGSTTDASAITAVLVNSDVTP